MAMGKTTLTRTPVGAMKTKNMGGPKRASEMAKRAMKGMRTGTMRKAAKKMMGGDLTPKPKGFGPADLGLIPSKKRKY